jgi:hypothetical protein
MRWFPDEVIYGMVGFAPLSSFCVGVWAALEFIHGDSGGGFWLLLGAIVGLSAAALFTTWVVSQRKVLSQTVQVIRMAAEVLAANPSIYGISFALLSVYLIFIAVWMVFFLHALMLGHPDVAHRVWVLSTWSYYVQAFLVFMLIWTSIILSYIQKATIGGVLGRWYFFRSETTSSNRNGENTWLSLVSNVATWEALLHSVTRFFGQICLASLILTFVRITRMSIQLYKFVGSSWAIRMLVLMLSVGCISFGILQCLQKCYSQCQHPGGVH